MSGLLTIMLWALFFLSIVLFLLSLSEDKLWQRRGLFSLSIGLAVFVWVIFTLLDFKEGGITNTENLIGVLFLIISLLPLFYSLYCAFRVFKTRH